MKTDFFQSSDHCWVFQLCWHIECSTFTASSFRIWNSSIGIPSPPLALLIVMLLKAHLTSHSRMSDSRWVIIPSWLSGSWRSFLHSSSVYSCHLISSALISHASKVMLKILQVRLQQYMNQELPDVQAWFRKGRGTRDQIANICWVTEKAREFQKNIYFCFIDYRKTSDCVDHNELWKILKEMGIPDHLTCLLRNLYVDQKATVRTRHGTMD